ncbi:DUF4397 domain-containing protein [Natronosporangium hydrolyticum]|uniref:DUF4397 domain-containing protein n=1 Tax=Natronosporangium hydrolyticum TaxID=2811111 RepID=A0A895YD48_9ACTN|nr:DUF4397 domain-containing protein [Natronosporangium hydrolyticum]QSB14125.1 DUF4397 domain-containing protein [Natronosporangium hydrolyticum]
MRTSQIRRPLAVTAIAAVTAGAGLALASPAQAQETSQVSVVHGIPGQDVDVYVDGDALLEGFAPGEIAGPLDLPAGAYDIVITAPGGDPDSEAILEVDGAEVPGGANLSLVAHLSEDGEPTLTPFANDVSEVAAGDARLTVRHTAAAPAVDVRAGGEPVFTDLTNPNEDGADLPAGTVDADVVLAGTEDVVLGPADLDLAEGTATIVYAIGSAEDDTLDLVVQTIDGLHSPPSGVPSGTGGQAATGVAAGWFAAAAAGLMLVIGGAFGLRHYRRTALR